MSTQRSAIVWIAATLIGLLVLSGCDTTLSRVEADFATKSDSVPADLTSDGLAADRSLEDRIDLEAETDAAGSLDQLDAIDLSDQPELPEQTFVIWDPASPEFFDRPWPESQRLDADGTLALAGFPNPSATLATCKLGSDPIMLLVGGVFDKQAFRSYMIGALDRLFAGFGTNTPIYFRFNGPLDSAALPTVFGSTGETSKLFLINVEANSPRRGQRVPIISKLLKASSYLPTNVLGLIPQPGFVLAPNEQHAAVVMRGLGDSRGRQLSDNPAFELLKSSSPTTAQQTLYHGVFSYLESLGVKRGQIAAMTLFRTGDPARALRQLMPKVEALSPSLAQPQDLIVKAFADYYRVSGTLNTVNFQRGDGPYIPWLDFEKLRLTWDVNDSDGELITDQPFDSSPDAPGDRPRLSRIRFTLTIPKQAIVAALAGNNETTPLPLAVYGHGTGGSWRSFIGNGTAKRLSPTGLAMISIDGIMHHDRAGVANIQPQLKQLLTELGSLKQLEDFLRGGNLGFNVLSVPALAGNIQQSALDYLWLARAIPQLALAVKIDNELVTLKFDPAKVFYMGHSQGAMVGPLSVFAPWFSGYFLSAGAGHMILWTLTKTVVEQGLTMQQLANFVICDPESELDLFHPLMTLFQLASEPMDALNYMPYFFNWPNPGGRKHLFQTQGQFDNWTPLSVGDAVSTAGRLNHVGPVLQSLTGQQLLGYSPYSADLSGNILLDGVSLTAGFKQYTCGEHCSEDHFVVTNVPRAKDDQFEYFQSLIDDELPTIPFGP